MEGLFFFPTWKEIHDSQRFSGQSNFCRTQRLEKLVHCHENCLRTVFSFTVQGWGCRGAEKIVMNYTALIKLICSRWCRQLAHAYIESSQNGLGWKRTLKGHLVQPLLSRLNETVTKKGVWKKYHLFSEPSSRRFLTVPPAIQIYSPTFLLQNSINLVHGVHGLYVK